MNVRKIVARLNAQTIRFGIGRGGLPALTNQDIAAAVGMITDVFAREVFCAIWWPEGANLDSRMLIRLVARAQREVLESQMRDEQVARLELHIAQENFASVMRHRSEDGYEIQRLQGKLDDVRRKNWPMNPVMYPVVREAVLAELTKPNQCEQCHGQSDIKVGELVVVCPRCNGTSIVPVTQATRARAIGVKPSGYSKDWRKVYEWTYQLLASKEQDGATDLAKRLA